MEKTTKIYIGLGALALTGIALYVTKDKWMSSAKEEKVPFVSLGDKISECNKIADAILTKREKDKSVRYSKAPDRTIENEQLAKIVELCGADFFENYKKTWKPNKPVRSSKPQIMVKKPANFSNVIADDKLYYVPEW